MLACGHRRLMNKQIISRIVLAAFAISVWLPQSDFVLAQTPVRETPTAAAPGPSAPAQTITTGQSAGVPLGPQVIYGLQGVLVETLDGKPVAVQSADETFNPASAIKLATALFTLRTFGPEHRFTTGIWTTGTLEKATGTLNGNLYVSGRDPSFHYEHAVMIARQLNLLGIRTVTGNLVVAPGFTMNFN